MIVSVSVSLPDRTVSFSFVLLVILFLVFNVNKLSTWTRTTLHIGPILHTPHQRKTNIITIGLRGIYTAVTLTDENSLGR